VSHKLCDEKWQFETALYFIRFEAALKSEIRISKHETNSNDKNLNDKNSCYEIKNRQHSSTTVKF